jgi:hypothetical protein
VLLDGGCVKLDSIDTDIYVCDCVYNEEMMSMYLYNYIFDIYLTCSCLYCITCL